LKEDFFMKKFFTIGMAVLLGVSLSFLGCEQEAETDDTPKPVDVTGYSLKASEDAGAGPAASGLTLVSATELDGVVTLTLGGKVTSDYVLKGKGAGTVYEMGDAFQPEADYWVGTNERPAEGLYTPVYVNGVYAWEGTGAKILAVKNTNQALRLYANNPSGEFLTETPTGPTINRVNNQKTVWMPAATSTAEPVRWKLYDSGRISKNDTFGILIWNGGTGTTYTPKTATLVIQEYDGYAGTDGQATTSNPKTDGFTKTVVIDYSGVTFEEPPVKVAASGATADSIKTALDTANTSVVVLTADTATTVTLNDALTVPAGKTLKVGTNVTLSVASSKTLSVAATLDVAGTLDVADGGSATIGDADKYVKFAKATITGASGTTFAGASGTATFANAAVLSLAEDGTLETKGTGTAVFGATTFSGVGVWTATATGGSAGGGVSITSAAAGATIVLVPGTGSRTAAELTASGTSPAITQAAGTGNALTIGAATVVNLGASDNSANLGSIKLTKGTNPGKLTLAAATSVVYTLAAKTDGSVYASTLTSVDTDLVLTGITKAEVFHATDKLTKLTGDADGTSITAVASGSGVNTIGATTVTAGS
jgi:hypothetical protein